MGKTAEEKWAADNSDTGILACEVLSVVKMFPKSF